MDQDKERARELYQQMSFKEKALYLIQNYYRLAIVILVILAIVISFIGNLTWRKGPDRVIGIGLHANVMDSDLAAKAADDFGTEFPSMVEDGRAFYTYWFYNGYNPSQVEQIESTTYQLAGCIAAEQLDVIMGDRSTLEKDCQFQYAMPLTEIFSLEELEKIEQAAGNEEAGINGVELLSFDVTNDIGRTMKKVRDVPYMIRITGASTTVDGLMMNCETYLIVTANAQQQEEVRQFVFDMLNVQ